MQLVGKFNRKKDEFASKTFLSAAGSIFVLFSLTLSENYFSVTTLMVPVSIIVSISIGVVWQEIGNNFKHTLK